MESRLFPTRIPDDKSIRSNSVAILIPNAGRYYFVATRDEAAAMRWYMRQWVGGSP